MPPKKEPHRYKLLYKVEKPAGGVTPADVPEGHGATDALLMASILYPKDGSLSVLFIGIDGRPDGDLDNPNSNLDDNEWFKVWTMLTKRLADSPTLPPGKKEFCRLTFEQFRGIMMNAASSSASATSSPRSPADDT